MALVYYDRVQETSSTAGTGTITLAGAVSGFQSFAIIGNGNTTYYTIVDGANWEVGIGTYTTSGTTLARTIIISNSSGTTVAITLSGNSKNVFCTYPAEKAVIQDAASNVTVLNALTGSVISASNGLVINNKSVAVSYIIPSGYSAMSVGPITIATGQTVTVPSGSKWVVL